MRLATQSCRHGYWRSRVVARIPNRQTKAEDLANAIHAGDATSKPRAEYRRDHLRTAAVHARWGREIQKHKSPPTCGILIIDGDQAQSARPDERVGKGSMACFGVPESATGARGRLGHQRLQYSGIVANSASAADAASRFLDTSLRSTGQAA